MCITLIQQHDNLWGDAVCAVIPHAETWLYNRLTLKHEHFFGGVFEASLAPQKQLPV